MVKISLFSKHCPIGLKFGGDLHLVKDTKTGKFGGFIPTGKGGVASQKMGNFNFLTVLRFLRRDGVT